MIAFLLGAALIACDGDASDPGNGPATLTSSTSTGAPATPTPSETAGDTGAPSAPTQDSGSGGGPGGSGGSGTSGGSTGSGSGAYGDSGAPTDTGTPTGDTADTAAPCAELVGSAMVWNALDVAALAGFCSVTGDLDIHAVGMALVSLPDLQAVGGDVRIQGATDQTTSLPALRTIGGELMIWNLDGQSEVDVSSLEAVDAITVEGLEHGTLRAPALTATGGVHLIDATDLVVELAALTTVGTLEAADIGMLTLEVPSLTDADLVDVLNSELAAFPFASLARAGDVTIEYVADAALDWSFDALEEVDYILVETTELVPSRPAANVALPSLVRADGIYLQSGIAVIVNESVSVSLPVLEEATDIAVATNDDGTEGRTITLEVPVLRTARDLVVAAWGVEGSFDFPSLEVLDSDGSARLYGVVHAPLLTSAGDITHYGFGAADVLDLPALVDADQIDLWPYVAPVAYQLPMLVTAHSIELTTQFDDPAIEQFLDLPSLTFITYELEIFPSNGPIVLSAPSLTDIFRDLTLVVDERTSLPALTLVDGQADLVLSGPLDLPALTTVDASGLTIWGCLPSLPALESVHEDIEVYATPCVVGPTELVLPALTTAGGLTIDDSDTITRVSAPLLGTLTGTVTFGNEALSVTDNDVLDTIDLPALSLLDGDMVVTSNPLLCEGVTETWAMGIPTLTGTVTIVGNDPGC